MATPGSTFTATGITSQPAYAYAPPAEFFATEAPGGIDVFDIRDFGAVADAAVDNRPMIQAAVDAASAAGGGVVYVPPGVWGIAAATEGYGSIHLLDNVFLKGAGMGESTLRLVDGSSGDITGLVRSQWGVENANFGMADLTIDGNQANTTGAVDGFFTGPTPGTELRDSDVHVLRVEITGVSRYGFDPHEQTERLSITDSVAHHNGVDGFVLDFILDSELSGNVSYANGRHGFNFVTTSQNILLTDNIAHDNGAAGFVIQRGSEDIVASHDITLVGGASYGNGRDGVLVHMANDVVISGMSIHDNGTQGVRIYGASNVTVENNEIHDNSRAADGAYSGVLISEFVDTVYGRTYAAENNLVEGNAIYVTEGGLMRYGIEERAGDTGGNVFLGNTVSGTARGPLSINGTGSYTINPGTDGDDLLVGTSTQDHITGGDGNDVMSGQDGRDLLEGGLGDDVIGGGKGNDIISGGDGADALSGNSGDDQLDGGAGNDTMSGNSGRDHLFGGLGDDKLNGGTNDDIVEGGAGNDSVTGGEGYDVLMGGEGADTLSGGSEDDLMFGGDGNDVVGGGSGNDIIVADAGDDRIDGGSDFDTLTFEDIGNGVSVDLLAKTATGAGRDTITSIERVVGSAFDDMLSGDGRGNVFVGGAGDDLISGRGGADVMTGGAGADAFVYSARKDVVDSGIWQGLDHITDFTAGEDVLDLRLLALQSDAVRVADAADGAIVSVDFGSGFVDVVQLDGIHGLTAAAMFSEGMLLA